MNNVEQADGKSKRRGGYHQYLKKRKRKLERRKARANVEAQPTYGRYTGWET